MKSQFYSTRGATGCAVPRSNRFAVLLSALCVLSILCTPALPGQNRSLTRKASAPMVLSAADSARAIDLLRSRIDRVLDDRDLRTASVGVVVHSLDADKTMYAHNDTKLLTPASTTKLFSTFTAFYTFGGDYNVPTSVYTDTDIIENGVLKGNLYIVGGGDPLLSTRDIEQLAEQIRNLGITHITGHVYGDASYFDNITNRMAYSGDADEVQALAPISALSLNRNEVTVLVTSGGAAGAPVRVQTVPVSDAFSFTVSATVKGGRKARPRISVRQGKGAGGKQHFTITGSLPPRRTVSYSFTVTNPALVAAGVLRSRLESVGVKVDGKAEVRTASPATSHALTAVYRPLGEIVSFVNKNSDNYAAEHIFKMVGGSVREQHNTAVAARNLMQTSFAQCEIPFQNCCLNDGSGLSRRNLVSPRSLVGLLVEAWQQPFAQQFVHSFAVAGVDGTLKRRMKGTPAEGNLIAKTGTLRNVSALAGYVTTLDGEQLAFSILFNGNSVGTYKRAENSIGELLAEFSYASALQGLSEQ